MVDVSVIGDDSMDLPPGFRFHPTDEEIISSYLTEKVLNVDFSARAIGEVDLNKCEPWDLPKKAKMGEKEWYFFCQRDRKYPTGMRTNRATESGYWKATGKDKEIYKWKNCLVGMKKTLVFYRGRAPKGEKTNWVMHEYRLDGKFSYHNLPRSAKDEWVVCRVFHKSSGVKKIPISPGLLRLNSFGDDFFDTTSLPSLLDDPPFNEKFDGTTATTTPQSTTSMMRTSEANQLSYSTSLDTNNHQQHQDNKNFLPNNFSFSTYQTNPYNNPNYYPQIQNTLYPFQPPSSSAYLHQDINFNSPDQAFLRALAGNNNDADAYGLKRECKVEQFSSNQSRVSLSQDTGLSTDVNTTEISSVVSRNDMGGNTYEDLERPSSSSGPVQDLDPLWNY